MFSTALADLDRTTNRWRITSNSGRPRIYSRRPTATRADLQRAAKDVLDGGLFRYFFRYPTMRVGEYKVYWQRPWLRTGRVKTMRPSCDVRLPGYFTAYELRTAGPRPPDRVVPAPDGASCLSQRCYAISMRRTIIIDIKAALNILTILDMSERWHEPPAAQFRTQMLRMAKEERLRSWLDIMREQ
jgi:hypothetical protein